MTTDTRETERQVDVVPEGMMALLNKSEIDQQVATAHKFPRSVKRFRDECLALVTLNEQVSQECIYALPRGGKTIEGPSARFAEIVINTWGNCRGGARIVAEDNEFVTAQGVFHDLEKNVAITYEVKRRITDKAGRRYNADMIGVTANAACSIALRNAGLKGVPKAFWADMYDAARKVVMGDSKTLATRRADAIAYLQKFGVTPEMIFNTLGVKGIEDIGLEQLVTLRGLATAIKDGDTTVEQAFPTTKPMTCDIPAVDMETINHLCRELDIFEAEKAMRIGSCKGDPEKVKALIASLNSELDQKNAKTGTGETPPKEETIKELFPGGEPKSGKVAGKK